jgi:integrase
MAKVQAFTPASVDNLKTGKLNDPTRPGLSIEVTSKGKLWRYYRRVARSTTLVRLSLGSYPAFSIADAREWADGLNAKVERGEDPRAEIRATKALEAMTLDAAHVIYMAAARKGERKQLKPRTLADKQSIYDRDIAPTLGKRPLVEITSDDLWAKVEAKAETTKVRANRLAAELKVMFGWFVSRAGQKAGIILPVDPSTTLNGSHYAESKGRSRVLSDEEIGWLFRALASDALSTNDNLARLYRRAILLLLLTGCRFSEVIEAPACEISGSVWTIPGERTKNHQQHIIPLAPWMAALARTNGKWLIEKDGAAACTGWWKIRGRVHAKMEELAERKLPVWTYHDLRRTLRSNTFPLGIRYEVAEAMINHERKGLERRYDVGDLSGYVAEGFRLWEDKLVGIAQAVGLADALYVPVTTEPENRSSAEPLAA